MSLGIAAPRRPRRRPGLTPMIDVVFLLLVFFLLAARFGAEGALSAAAPGAGSDWRGPPRLVEVAPEGRLFLNGVSLEPAALVEALARLAPEPGDPVVLRGRAGATVQDLASAMEALAAAGFAPLVLAE